MHRPVKVIAGMGDVAHAVSDVLAYGVATLALVAIAITLTKGPRATERREAIKKAQEQLRRARKMPRF